MKKVSADYVRNNFPECVAIADMVRSEFGNGVKVTYMNEGSKEVGKRADVALERSVTLKEVIIESHENFKGIGNGKK